MPVILTHSRADLDAALAKLTARGCVVDLGLPPYKDERGYRYTRPAPIILAWANHNGIATIMAQAIEIGPDTWSLWVHSIHIAYLDQAQSSATKSGA